jgi:hypothetical protein
VNTAVEANADIGNGGDPIHVTGGAELSEALAQSTKINPCFTRHFFRYTMARAENLDASVDGCVLEEMRQSLSGTAGAPGGLQTLIKRVPKLKNYNLRKTN